MTTIIFDIETGPLPEAELANMLPPFDPAEVKTGNLKDPAKIAEKIAEAEANHRRDFFDKAALDPLTGRVVAIGLLVFDARGEAGPFKRGMRNAECGRGESTPHPDPMTHSRPLVRPGGPSSSQIPTAASQPAVVPDRGGEGIESGRFCIVGHEDEAQTLREFWDMTCGEMGRMNPLVGFNIFSFDLPFLLRRSWKHRIPLPFALRRGRYWDNQLHDLREYWQLGDRQARGSLDSIAKHLGVGSKNGEGKAFAELWKTDRKQAEAYLHNDLELTAKIAAALGVVA